METPFDDILNGTEPEAIVEQPEAETPEPTAEAEPTGPARGPDGKFIPKGEKEDAPPASENVFEGKSTLAERQKRQAAEARIAALEAQLQQLSNPPQAPVDMFDDPEGFKDQFGQQVTGAAVQQASLNARLDTSEMLAAQAHDDFEDMRPKILALMEENPSLRQQVLSDRHPWNKAYQIAKNLERAESLGAVDAEDLRAKIREEVLAELKAKPEVELPTSLASAQSGRASASAPFAPLDLNAFLNSR